MPNRLAAETSPYLLQHAQNPVDWYPWGDEAIERARNENRPIFLSIGYSACHWCHVMEHESFESESIAATLNEHFVCIKVDREERPDLDHIYMTAVQMMTQHGGWPMSVFLTPDLHPFFGGTYWPPQRRMGMPGFDDVLAAVIDAWQNRQKQAQQQAERLTARIRSFTSGGGARVDAAIDGTALVSSAATALAQAFDAEHGGFGDAPKFPHAMDLQLLLRHWRRTGNEHSLLMVRRTLDKMRQGGIYDHLGGGFARYSVDAQWLVPHFEKMLYDNALLSAAYLDAYLVTSENRYLQTARETLDYVLRDMTDACGGFHSTEDADSEGVEGKYYVWTPDEIEAVLGEEAGERFCRTYDVTANGNFEGRSILNLRSSMFGAAEPWGADLVELERELAVSRRTLLAARAQRVRPGKDDKIITSWNGLMIHTMAAAGAITRDRRYTEGAAGAARFLLNNLRSSAGRLLHVWRCGQARLPAYLDDYAALANGLVTLYEATFDESWIDAAVQLVEQMLNHFVDAADGGFFYTADDHEALIARTKDLHDGSVPSGSSLAATVLIRLGKLCGRTDWLELARRTIESALPVINHSPTAAGQMLAAVDSWEGPFTELVVCARTEDESLIGDLWSTYAPNRVLAMRVNLAGAHRSPHLNPLFLGRELVDDQPTAYLCHDHACEAPVVGRAAILARLGHELPRERP
ncbi:MAG: thioredoxin domain-containing protein [Planctomycetales bacterium]|nr:thioredoxin domain-containing protein [Planctomycetales bacterium]